MSTLFPPTGDILRLGRISGNAVNGGWSSWASWSQCSRDCSRGIRSRKRTCSNPEPKYGGQTCQGPAQEYQECNITPCPGEKPARLGVQMGGCAANTAPALASLCLMGVEKHSQGDLSQHQMAQNKSVADKRCGEGPNLHQESGTIPVMPKCVITSRGNYAVSRRRPSSGVKSLKTMRFFRL